ncbi:hypothetical protein C7271_06650 [filamentous cyanobacterium CCP5]|nr:hypothetical protein C7271_06650 [filamentous cyanobacterium CCP5]
MFWITDSLRAKTSDFQPQRRRLMPIMRGFWQFSNFYGEYHALPVKDRRRYVQDFEHQKIQQRVPCQ